MNKKTGQRLSALVVDHLREGVIITNAACRILQVNPAFTAITGYEAHEVLGKTPRVLHSGRQDPAFYESMWHTIRTHGRWAGEIWNRRRNGEVYPQWLDVCAVRDAQDYITHYIGITSDLTKRKALEEQLHHLAWHDPLTGLPNRRLLEARLGEAIVRAEREGHFLAVLFLDLNQFKGVNDSLGHEAGDRVLRKVAERLSAFLRDRETLARQGGDEFILLLPQVDDPETVAGRTEQLLHAFAQPLDLEGLSLHVSLSIGIALFPVCGRTSEDLLRHADTAMFATKNALAAQGWRWPGGYLFYGAPGNESLREQLKRRREIDQALAGREFALHYQPQVDLRSGAIVGAEALVRWHHPREGFLLPAEFIALAERTSQIIALGEWVIEEACRQLCAWDAVGLRLAVNLSARQLASDSLLAHVHHCLKAHGIDPRRLEFEITETVLLEESQAMRRFIGACHKSGIDLLIDDFGIGYSSLESLRSLPVGALKIDQRFIAGMAEDAKNRVIVKAAIDIAHAMGLRAIAEGVETEEQARALQALGCDLAQGYWFSPPLSPGDFERHTKARCHGAAGAAEGVHEH